MVAAVSVLALSGLWWGIGDVKEATPEQLPQREAVRSAPSLRAAAMEEPKAVEAQSDGQAVVVPTKNAVLKPTPLLKEQVVKPQASPVALRKADLSPGKPAQEKVTKAQARRLGLPPLADMEKECRRAALLESMPPSFCSCDVGEFEQMECQVSATVAQALANNEPMPKTMVSP